MKKYEQNATRILSEIKVLTAQNEAKILKINATANATKLQLNQQAKATALDNTINAETDAYVEAKKVSDPRAPPDQFVGYEWSGRRRFE